jgi:ribonuclease HI
MGGGAVLKAPNGGVISEGCWPLGNGTNNVAEWKALIQGLRLAREHGVRKLRIFMDSELVVKQVTGEYRVKQHHLMPLHSEAMDLLRGFADYRIDHVGRGENGQADALANKAIDRGRT